MRVIYNIGIYLLKSICFLLSFFNRKIKAMLYGQKETFYKINQIKEQDNIAWFHCASLGEFEQARNLIEEFKEKYPNYKILLSFFSPSGYEVRKNYSHADYVVYLPWDTKKNARTFIKLARPKIVFFVKYEFWYNYIIELKNIPLFQVSLILQENHYLTKFYSFWFRKQLGNFNAFFVQDTKSKEILETLGYKNSEICGDTRFDRVLQISKQKKDFPLIDAFCFGEEKIFIAGSSWPEDERVIDEVFENKPNFKLIIVPHEIDKPHLNNLQKLFTNSLLYSKANEENVKDKKVLIIDCMGILSYIYSKADITYVGGGFGVGIHNILEAAVFYKPVAFGPNNKKFREARELLALSGAKEIHNAKELSDWVENLLRDERYYQQSCYQCGNYVKSNAGATQKILDKVKTYL
ncbi:MAG: glycosyltransferase N-terminal domain-containing protein [Bacteroidota bacterium]|nr:glycosyltransferase N-terminal domain-containing protein [Bacteroidota bacterium]